MTNGAAVTGSSIGRRRWSATVASLLAVLLTAAVLIVAPLARPSAADTAPLAPGEPETVSADALPTVQINGVVWDQVIVGNRVYATGQFTQARPAGAAPGTNETPRVEHPRLRPHHRAADHHVGARAQRAGHGASSASADGSTIYVGGDFDRVTEHRAGAAGALASGGARRPDGHRAAPAFAPVANTRVARARRRRQHPLPRGRVHDAGRDATERSGPQPASRRLGAVNATTGALLPWTPTADRGVVSLVTAQRTASSRPARSRPPTASSSTA